MTTDQVHGFLNIILNNIKIDVQQPNVVIYPVFDNRDESLSSQYDNYRVTNQSLISFPLNMNTSLRSKKGKEIQQIPGK